MNSAFVVLGALKVNNFFQCNIDHPLLVDLLKPIQKLYEDVRRKALMRLEYEGLHKAEAITTRGARFYKDPAGFAMDRYAYYVCFKCTKVRDKPLVYAILSSYMHVFG